ncbi:basic proline-rich protein-like [Vidua macroura]|uniref:basic proline-rich protein-like n=1 Tax=Vidua macroura TaxID=187451 RepID=UPI0023A88C4D|nr:basic proline-rich protein-like [Vidua macroura]
MGWGLRAGGGGGRASCAVPAGNFDAGLSQGRRRRHLREPPRVGGPPAAVGGGTTAGGGSLCFPRIPEIPPPKRRTDPAKRTPPRSHLGNPTRASPPPPRRGPAAPTRVPGGARPPRAGRCAGAVCGLRRGRSCPWPGATRVDAPGPVGCGACGARGGAGQGIHPRTPPPPHAPRNRPRDLPTGVARSPSPPPRVSAAGTYVSWRDAGVLPRGPHGARRGPDPRGSAGGAGGGRRGSHSAPPAPTGALEAPLPREGRAGGVAAGSPAAAARRGGTRAHPRGVTRSRPLPRAATRRRRGRAASATLAVTPPPLSVALSHGHAATRRVPAATGALVGTDGTGHALPLPPALPLAGTVPTRREGPHAPGRSPRAVTRSHSHSLSLSLSLAPPPSHFVPSPPRPPRHGRVPGATRVGRVWGDPGVGAAGPSVRVSGCPRQRPGGSETPHGGPRTRATPPGPPPDGEGPPRTGCGGAERRGGRGGGGDRGRCRGVGDRRGAPGAHLGRGGRGSPGAAPNPHRGYRERNRTRTGGYRERNRTRTGGTGSSTEPAPRVPGAEPNPHREYRERGGHRDRSRTWSKPHLDLSRTGTGSTGSGVTPGPGSPGIGPEPGPGRTGNGPGGTGSGAAPGPGHPGAGPERGSAPPPEPAPEPESAPVPRGSRSRPDRAAPGTGGDPALPHLSRGRTCTRLDRTGPAPGAPRPRTASPPRRSPSRVAVGTPPGPPRSDSAPPPPGCLTAPPPPGSPHARQHRDPPGNPGRPQGPPGPPPGPAALRQHRDPPGPPSRPQFPGKRPLEKGSPPRAVPRGPPRERRGGFGGRGGDNRWPPRSPRVAPGGGGRAGPCVRR